MVHVLYVHLCNLHVYMYMNLCVCGGGGGGGSSLYVFACMWGAQPSRGGGGVGQALGIA